MLRLSPRALLAALALAAALPAAASAMPRVQIDPQDSTRALYTDANGQYATETLDVSAQRAGTTTTYTFFGGANAIVAVAPCTQTAAAIVTCVVANGSGASIDVGPPATDGAGQTVTLKDSGWAQESTTITGGDGPDLLRGANGADTIIGGGGADQIYGSTGFDVASYEGTTDAVRAAIDDAPDSGAGCPKACEGDTIHSDIEALAGGSGDDVLTGNAGPNTLSGGAGNDTLQGGLGADKLDGGAGSNTADYSQDDRGGNGVDVNLAAGTERAHGSNELEDTLVTGTIQHVVGTAGPDALTGSSAADVFDAGAGDDTLALVDGKADTAHCGAGNDTVDADDIDVLDVCENVKVTKTDGGGSGGGAPQPPASPCTDADSCGSLVTAIFKQVFGCDSAESCQQQYPVPSGPGAPTPPCSDPQACGDLVTSVFAQVFGCDSVESCQEQYPAPGGGGSGPTPGPPCSDAASCGEYFAGVFKQVFGCDSVESCQAAYGGGQSGPPPSPCNDPASCGEYFKGVFKQVFGCDSAESCQARYAPSGSGSGNDQPPASSPPASSEPSTNGSSTPPRTKPHRAATRVQLRIRARRDRRRPFRFVVTGVVRSAGSGSCTGVVRLVLVRGHRQVGRRTVRVGAGCRFRATVRSTRAGRLRLVVRYLGDGTHGRSPLVRRSVRAG